MIAHAAAGVVQIAGRYTMKYRDAIAQAMVDALARDPKALILGQNVTTPHGVFGTTALAYERFPDRVLEIPISETMITGMCVGMALEGWKPILVHTRADFGLFSFEHLINTAAKMPFLHGRPLPLVVRMIVGRGWGQGPVHSQSWHNLLSQIPGLGVIVPSMGHYRWVLDALALAEPARATVIIEPRRLYEEEDSTPPTLSAYFSRRDIILRTIGDAVLDAGEARRTLLGMGIVASVEPWDVLSERPITVGNPVPTVLIDMFPNPDADVAPRGIQGVSQVYEKAYYPTADDIVEAVCRKLGKPITERKESHEPDRVRAGSPF